MENKSEQRPHESDSAKGSSKSNLSHSGSQSGNPQRGRTEKNTQQSGSLRGSGRSSTSNMQTDGGAPSRQTSDAQNSSGQL